MKTYKIAVMPGDGTGPEVTAEALKVLAAANPRHPKVLRKKELRNPVVGGIDQIVVANEIATVGPGASYVTLSASSPDVISRDQTKKHHHQNQYKPVDCWNTSCVPHNLVQALKRYLFSLENQIVEDLFHTVFLLLIEDNCKKLRQFRWR